MESEHRRRGSHLSILVTSLIAFSAGRGMLLWYEFPARVSEFFEGLSTRASFASAFVMLMLPVLILLNLTAFTNRMGIKILGTVAVLMGIFTVIWLVMDFFSLG